MKKYSLISSIIIGSVLISHLYGCAVGQDIKKSDYRQPKIDTITQSMNSLEKRLDLIQRFDTETINTQRGLFSIFLAVLGFIIAATWLYNIKVSKDEIKKELEIASGKFSEILSNKLKDNKEYIDRKIDIQHGKYCDALSRLYEENSYGAACLWGLRCYSSIYAQAKSHEDEFEAILIKRIIKCLNKATDFEEKDLKEMKEICEKIDEGEFASEKKIILGKIEEFNKKLKG